MPLSRANLPDVLDAVLKLRGFIGGTVQPDGSPGPGWNSDALSYIWYWRERLCELLTPDANAHQTEPPTFDEELSLPIQAALSKLWWTVSSAGWPATAESRKAETLLFLDEVSQVCRKGMKEKTRRTRKRKAPTAELLLALLDDRRYANMSITELAKFMRKSKSAISRAFRNNRYGQMIRDRYESFGINPPTIDQV